MIFQQVCALWFRLNEPTWNILRQTSKRRSISYGEQNSHFFRCFVCNVYNILMVLRIPVMLIYTAIIFSWWRESNKKNWQAHGMHMNKLFTASTLNNQIWCLLLAHAGEKAYTFRKMSVDITPFLVDVFYVCTQETWQTPDTNYLFICEN